MGDGVKRLIDVLISLLLVICLFPALLVVAVAVKLTSEGPVLFIQERVGLGCRFFMIYKFRTMVVGAEQIGGYRTQQSDFRITWLGSFLRRSSLDELPQLLNVLKGDMSLVGPRPDTPMQKTCYVPKDWIKRHTVRPGITGLAQVRIRSAGTGEQRLQLDLEYVDGRTLMSDLRIMAETLVLVFTRSGAN